MEGEGGVGVVRCGWRGDGEGEGGKREVEISINQSKKEKTDIFLQFYSFPLYLVSTYLNNLPHHNSRRRNRNRPIPLPTVFTILIIIPTPNNHLPNLLPLI